MTPAPTLRHAVDDSIAAPIARINGVALHPPGQRPAESELRQRAHSELLRQAAMREGLLADDEPSDDGIVSEKASAAVEALIDRVVTVPEPQENDCRRYFAAHAARFRRGERARVRHILFAVTPGVDIVRLRGRAEQAMLEVRCFDDSQADPFAAAAAALSNCPSGAAGGELGWMEASDCVPEFARELFGKHEVGVLPRLVHSRYGFHVVDVQERDAGEALSFDAVRGAVGTALRQQAFAVALRHYLGVLAGAATIEGVDLDATETPLVQ